MPTPTEVTPFGRDYFTKSVILADPADLDIGQIARVKAMSGVQWSVLYVASGGATSAASIYPDRSGAAYATPSGTTGTDGTINFWAAPGEYRVVITDPSNRISVPNGHITWNSIPAWTEGVPGDFISGNKQITRAKIADLAINADKLDTGAVTSAKILDGTIESGDLAPNSVTTEKILDGQITNAKLVMTGLPVGAITQYALATAPVGWLLCDGGQYAVATYPLLDALLGVTYGARTNGVGGAGSTHFRVPDARGRVAVGAGTGAGGGTAGSGSVPSGAGLTPRAVSAWAGAETHTLITAEIAAHTHTGNSVFPVWNVSVTNGSGYLATNAEQTTRGFTTNPTGGGGAHPNVQPMIVVAYIIKATIT